MPAGFYLLDTTSPPGCKGRRGLCAPRGRQFSSSCLVQPGRAQSTFWPSSGTAWILLRAIAGAICTPAFPVTATGGARRKHGPAAQRSSSRNSQSAAPRSHNAACALPGSFPSGGYRRACTKRRSALHRRDREAALQDLTDNGFDC